VGGDRKEGEGLGFGCGGRGQMKNVWQGVFTKMTRFSDFSFFVWK
jgi:hypothetical protein